jgi:hypothetical protein
LAETIIRFPYLQRIRQLDYRIATAVIKEDLLRVKAYLSFSLFSSLLTRKNQYG